MGPAIIFDKSVIEALTADEAVWLDHFYLSVLTPSFYVETLADLEKEPRGGKTAEQVVGNIAYKVPDFSSKMNILYQTMVEGELFGRYRIKMDGRPVIGGGRTVMLEGGTGTFFEVSPEEEAYTRWQNHEYRELEKHHAKKWREMLSNLNFEANYIHFQNFFPTGKPKSLSGVKQFVDHYLNVPDQESVLIFGMSLCGIKDNNYPEVISKWKSEGKPTIKEFAPFFHHIVSLDLFFNLGIASDLIGRGRASHKIDLSYLYYLPCCKIFTSNDKFHKQIAPLFLSADQTFLAGDDLKADLLKIDQYYDRLPEEVKARGITSFAFNPPNKEEFLTSSLWDKYMSSEWRASAEKLTTYPKTQVTDRLQEHIEKVEHGRPLTDDELMKYDSDQDRQIVIKRMVAAKRGKWNRFPPEVLGRKKKSNGEWKDVTS